MSKQRSDHSTIFMPLNSKCQRIERLHESWRVWLSTADYRFGTYLLLGDNGAVVRVVAREDEGDQLIHVRPDDAYIERASNMRGIGDDNTHALHI